MMGMVSIAHDTTKKELCLEWEASAESDMWADAVVMVALELEDSPQAIRCKLWSSTGALRIAN